MIHEECRDFLKWYGKRDMNQLKKTFKALEEIIKAEEVEA